MRNDKLIDVRKIERATDLTKEMLSQITAKDAVYLKKKFGDQLVFNKELDELSSEFTSSHKDRLKSIEMKYR